MIEFEDGAHHFKPAKLDPLTISEDYKIKWRKTKTDLSKVAMDQEMVSGSHSRSFGAFT